MGVGVGRGDGKNSDGIAGDFPDKEGVRGDAGDDGGFLADVMRGGAGGKNDKENNI